MKIDFLEGLVLMEEQIKASREYEKIRNAMIATICLGGCLGLFFLAVGIALLFTGTEEQKAGGGACFALTALIFVIAIPIVYSCMQQKKELLREEKAYFFYEAELTDMDLSVSGGGRHSYAHLNLEADVLFRAQSGTLVQKSIRYVLPSGSYSKNQAEVQKIFVAYNEKTDVLLTFEEELQKLDNDEW